MQEQDVKGRSRLSNQFLALFDGKINVEQMDSGRVAWWFQSDQSRDNNMHSSLEIGLILQLKHIFCGEKMTY